MHGLPDSVSDQMKMNRDTKGLQVKLVNILNLCCTVEHSEHCISSDS